MFKEKKFYSCGPTGLICQSLCQVKTWQLGLQIFLCFSWNPGEKPKWNASIQGELKFVMPFVDINFVFQFIRTIKPIYLFFTIVAYWYVWVVLFFSLPSLVLWLLKLVEVFMLVLSLVVSSETYLLMVLSVAYPQSQPKAK